ncbi:MAG: hypothetical protein AAFU79_11295 [Myxococcota bacterium]
MMQKDVEGLVLVLRDSHRAWQSLLEGHGQLKEVMATSQPGFLDLLMSSKVRWRQKHLAKQRRVVEELAPQVEAQIHHQAEQCSKSLAAVRPSRRQLVGARVDAEAELERVLDDFLSKLADPKYAKAVEAIKGLLAPDEVGADTAGRIAALTPVASDLGVLEMATFENHFREIARLAAELTKVQRELQAAKNGIDVYFKFSSQVEAHGRFFANAAHEWKRTCQDVVLALNAALLDEQARSIEEGRDRLQSRIALIEEGFVVGAGLIEEVPSQADTQPE